ncbi:hypothetical protein [Stenotrophomonas sp. PFBMAA-4]|uniref:hypothetical protein n=1 Tax=Stenotrophomonas sp. PFBMAA-4 TaxID=3043301 RepID=UPI0024B4C34C|nr:hypothetical protein [Stenotrophomonas sp. PFBMAA-4]MDI9272378.1 hypothetical protein [Stenotrophomonas sp. PFBMAA-4]
MTMRFDAVVSVRFLSSVEGGRQGDIVGQVYACPLFVAGRAFECRLLLQEGRAVLGESYELPVAFLCPEEALATVNVGADVSLWEGKTIARGRVLHVMGSEPFRGAKGI